jgi:hypothetical protein
MSGLFNLHPAAGVMEEEVIGVGTATPQIIRTPSRGNGGPPISRRRFSVAIPVSQKQRRVQDVLDSIKATVTDPEQRFTPDLQKSISKTNEELLDATRDFGVLPQNDSADDDDETLQTPYLTPTSQTPDRGRKRKPDPEEEPGTPDVSQNTGFNQPFKRPRTRTQVGLRPPTDLSTLKPQPLQFQFPIHPEKERSNEWFQNEFRKLFNRLEAFSREYFGLHDLEEGEFHQPWAAGMTPEFLNYVEMVSDADPELGDWDQLLRSTKQRQWLIMAVLFRILEVKILSMDLWGADKEEKKLLFGIERAFLTREGALQALTAMKVY